MHLLFEDRADIFDLADQVAFHVLDGRVVDVGSELFNEGIENLIGFKIADLFVKVSHEQVYDFSAQPLFLYWGKLNFHRGTMAFHWDFSNHWKRKESPGASLRSLHLHTMSVAELQAFSEELDELGLSDQQPICDAIGVLFEEGSGRTV